MRKSQIPCPQESAEQTWIFRWAAVMSASHPELKLLFHIPNGGSRNKIEAAKLKAQGVKPGVPDICLPVPWLSALKACGYKAEICKGADEAVSMIEDYLNIRKRGQQNA